MSSAANLRVAKIFVIVLTILDLLLAIGITIKEHLSKKNDYKFIHHETEWNALYISLVVCAILMLYGIFRSEHLAIIASIVIKVISALLLTYAVIRGKLENIRCEKELCRYSESSYCPACYGPTVKNNFDYDYTRPWMVYIIFEIAAFVAYTCMSSKPKKRNQRSHFNQPISATTQYHRAGFVQMDVKDSNSTTV